jgi:hypothetical protein
MPRKRVDNPRSARQVSLDQLVWEPKLVAALTPDQRRQVLEACGAILSAMAAGTTTLDSSQINRGAAKALGVELLTTEELARRLGLKPATISNRIGRLDERHGVVRIDAKFTRINWPVFWAKLQAGEITWRSGGKL